VGGTAIPWRDVILAVARHTHTSIDQVEDWEIDKLISYSKSLGRQLKRERPRNS
jgi:hypothetical protein